MTGTVTNNATLITGAEDADSGSWDDVGGGAGSGQNYDIFVQGSASRGRKADNTQLGFGFDNSTSIDVSGSGTHVGYLFDVLQPGLLSTNGIIGVLGDASTMEGGNWSGWTVLTSADYPAKGGMQQIWLNPTITRDFGSGTLPLGSVRMFGAEWDMGDVSGNAQNCHIDTISYSASGMTLSGGTSGSPATYADLITEDETNAVGIISADFQNGPIKIGGANTYFRDANFAIKAGYQPAAASNWIRQDIDISEATCEIYHDSGFLKGMSFTVTGTAGKWEVGTVTLADIPALTLTSGVTWTGTALVASEQLTINDAVLDGCLIDSSTATSASLWDTANDPNGNLDNCSFISASNHAIEFGTNTPSGITLTGHSYTGYNASTGSNTTPSSGPTDATIYNNAGKALTITITDGQSPSVRNGAGATTTIVTGQITLKVTVLDDSTGLPIQDAHVWMGKESDKSELLNDATDANGIAQTTISYDTDTDVVGWARQMDLSGTDYEQKAFSGQYTSTGFSITIRLEPI